MAEKQRDGKTTPHPRGGTNGDEKVKKQDGEK